MVAALKPTHRLSDGLMRVQWGRLTMYHADVTGLNTLSIICVLVSIRDSTNFPLRLLSFFTCNLVALPIDIVSLYTRDPYCCDRV